MQGAKLSRSPRGIPQQSSSGPWDNIVKFLDSLMSKLRGNHVRFIVLVVFDFVNVFDSLYTFLHLLYSFILSLISCTGG